MDGLSVVYNISLHGEVQEWLNWPLSKSGMGQLIEGSNPSLSANKNRDLLVSVFIDKTRAENPSRGFRILSNVVYLTEFSQWWS